MRAVVAPLWLWVGPTNLGRRPMDLRPGLPRRPKFASLLSRCSFHAPWCAGLGVKTLAIGRNRLRLCDTCRVGVVAWQSAPKGEL